MVDSDKGITNLHAPNDIIVDASCRTVLADCTPTATRWPAAPDGLPVAQQEYGAR